jgi:hypothetical protein
MICNTTIRLSVREESGSFEDDDVISNTFKFLAKISDENVPNAPILAKHIIQDLKFESSKLAAKTNTLWEKMAKKERIQFEQLQTMQAATGNNLEHQEAVMIKQLRTTLESLQHESDINTASIASLQQKYGNVVGKIREVDYQQKMYEEKDRKVNAEIERYEAELRDLEEEYTSQQARKPILHFMRHRIETDVNQLRETYQHDSTILKNMESYSEKFLDVQGSLMQSCDIGENQLFQLNAQLFNHRKHQQVFLNFSQKHVDINTNLKSYFQQRDGERSEIMKDTHNTNNIDMINSAVKKISVQEKSKIKFENELNESKVTYGNSAYTKSEILFALKLMSNDSTVKLKKPLDLLNRIHKLNDTSKHIQETIEDHNKTLDRLKGDLKSSEQQLKEILQEHGSYSMVLRREVLDEWHSKVIESEKEEQAMFSLNMRFRRLVMQVQSSLDSLLLKAKQASVDDPEIFTIVNSTTNGSVAKKIEGLNSVMQKVLHVCWKDRGKLDPSPPTNGGGDDEHRRRMERSKSVSHAGGMGMGLGSVVDDLLSHKKAILPDLSPQVNFISTGNNVRVEVSKEQRTMEDETGDKDDLKQMSIFEHGEESDDSFNEDGDDDLVIATNNRKDTLTSKINSMVAIKREAEIRANTELALKEQAELIQERYILIPIFYTFYLRHTKTTTAMLTYPMIVSICPPSRNDSDKN